MSSLKLNQSAFCLCVLKSYFLIFHSSCSADDTRYNLMFSYIHHVGNALIVDEFKKASNIVLSLSFGPQSLCFCSSDLPWCWLHPAATDFKTCPPPLNSSFGEQWAGFISRWRPHDVTRRVPYLSHTCPAHIRSQSSAPWTITPCCQKPNPNANKISLFPPLPN